MFFFPGGDSCKQAGVYKRDRLQASNENNWTEGLRSTEKKIINNNTGWWNFNETITTIIIIIIIIMILLLIIHYWLLIANYIFIINN